MQKIVLVIIVSILLWSCSSSTTNQSSQPIVVNTPLISPGSTTQIIVTNNSATPIINPSIVLAPWLESIALNTNLSYNGALSYGQSHTFSFYLESDSYTESTVRWNYQYILTNSTESVLQIVSNLSTINPTLDVSVAPDPLFLPLIQDILQNADYYSDTPQILSADYGFQGINGVESGESNVIAAGGAWENVSTPGAAYRAYTSAPTPQDIEETFGYPTFLASSIPIVFSWPVLPSTVNRTDFSVTLNTGEVVQPFVASIVPNDEYNERSVIVIFGNFGNRLAPGTAGAIYPVSVSIVANLKLVGPTGVVSAVGLSKSSGNPYQPGGGPKLVAAKLSTMSTLGDTGFNNASWFNGNYPNNGESMYGESNAQYRLRMFTNAGFSPDGVTSLLPTDYESYFRIDVTYNGVESYLTQTGVQYNFPGYGNIEILGLADLGLPSLSGYNDGYIEDHDNQIDIILKGDRAAMQLITAVEVPSSGNYKQAYDPGGPGNNPTPGVIYTYPSSYCKVSVINALDNPMTVNYP